MLAFIGRKSLWLDEALASGVGSMGLVELIQKITTGTPHPPLTFLIIRLSSLMFGQTEAGLRILIALMVASASIPVYRLIHRRFGRRAAFWGAMLWAVSPFTVSLAQEVWVYGTNLSLSLWLLDLADLSWRGSRKALRGFILVGIAGLLNQHLFLISILIAGGFYFTIARKDRTSLKVPLISTGLLLLAYLPVGLLFLNQFQARGIRMSMTGFASGFRSGLFDNIQSEFFRLLLGGLLPDVAELVVSISPWLYAAVFANMVLIVLMLVKTALSAETPRRLKIWLSAALLLPLLLFWSDYPGIRQLAALWIPFIFVAGIVFMSYRWAGPIIVSLCTLALIPYYMLDTFPYHRSNWRNAVRIVEFNSRTTPDPVLIIGGKSTRLAWDFYSTHTLTCLTPGGDDPFFPDLDRSRIDLVALVDSLLIDNKGIWLLIDEWGHTRSHDLASTHHLDMCIRVSPAMEVCRIVKHPSNHLR